MYSFLSRQLAALTLASVALLAGCMHMSAPSNLDYSRTRSSEHGLYRATIKPDGDSTYFHFHIRPSIQRALDHSFLDRGKREKHS